jgi:hypothetical protein
MRQHKSIICTKLMVVKHVCLQTKAENMIVMLAPEFHRLTG